MSSLRLTKGDSRTLRLSVTDHAGDVLDLTGATVFFTVKKSLRDPDSAALIDKTVTSHTDPEAGITTIDIQPEDTLDIAPGTYFWALQYVSDGGAVTESTTDLVEVVADVRQGIS